MPPTEPPATVVPLRQVLVAKTRGIVGALVPTATHGFWEFLLRTPEGYRRVAGWHPVAPGDEVVVYLVDPDRPEELEQVNALYSDTWYVRESWRTVQHPWDDEIAVFAEWLPESGATVLETCCGSGRAAPAVVRSGNRLVGVDLAVPSLAWARDNAPAGATYVRGDAYALPFADGAFDAVLCLENSLGEFHTDPWAPLAEMIRVCRPGGRVIVGLRDARDPWVSGSPEGFVHVVRTFPPERRDLFVNAMREHPQVAAVEVRPGDERPWGGRVWHVGLTKR